MGFNDKEPNVINLGVPKADFNAYKADNATQLSLKIGGGVLALMSDFDTEIQNNIGKWVKKTITQVTPSRWIILVSGYVLELTSNANYKSVIMPVTVGRQIKATFKTSDVACYGIIFTDDNGLVISSAYKGTGVATQFTDVVASVPVGATKVYITSYTTDITFSTLDYNSIATKDDVAVNAANVEKLLLPYQAKNTVNYSVSTGSVSSTNGTIAVTSDKYTVIDVTAIDFLIFNTNSYGSNYGYAFFDAGGIFILGVKTVTVETVTIKVPDNAVTFKTCWNNTITQVIYSVTLATPTDIIKSLNGFNIKDINDKINATLETIIPTSVLGDVQSSFQMSDILATYNGIYHRKNVSPLGRFGDVTAVTNHDGTLIVYNGKAYCIYMQNMGSGDNASSSTATVQLAKYDINSQAVSRVEFLANGGTYDGIAVTGGSGSPNMVLVGSILHCYSASKVGNNYVFVHAEYDTTTDIFSNYSIVQCNGANLDYAFLNSEFNKTLADGSFNNFQFNSNIAVSSGVYYIGAVYGYGTGDAIIFSTTDFITFSVFYKPKYNIIPVFELSLYSDGTYLYCAQRPFYDTEILSSKPGYGVLYKLKISTKKVVDSTYIVNPSGRMSFCYDGTNLYLITNGIDRGIGLIYSIDTNVLAKSLLRFSSRGSFNYPELYFYNNEYYMLASGDNMGLTKVEIEHYNMDAVENSLLSIIV